MEIDSLGGVTIGGLFTKGCYRVGPEDNYSVPHKVRPTGVPFDSILVWSLINSKGNSYAYMAANSMQGTFYNNGKSTTIDFHVLSGTPSHNIVYRTKNEKVVFTYYNYLYVSHQSIVLERTDINEGTNLNDHYVEIGIEPIVDSHLHAWNHLTVVIAAQG